MTQAATVQNIRRMLFADLIAEVDELLSEYEDPELTKLHEALISDPGTALDKLQALKVRLPSSTSKAQAGTMTPDGAQSLQEKKW